MVSQMQSITTPSFSDPSRYQTSTIPRPTISQPTDVILQVYSTSINPIDVKKAAGAFKAVLTEQYPYQIGYDCAGVVTDVGTSVTRFKIGDEVYVRLPELTRGSWSEYAKSPEHLVALKPRSLSFSDAASLPLAATTALQALKKYKGSLSGKTVFVPAGLSGTGGFALQLAKNVFRADKVITTVSTSKIDKVPKFLGNGIVDQIIDYTKEDPMKVIPPGSVDFILDTTGQAMQFLSLMIPNTSTIVSISTAPSGTQLQASGVMQRSDSPKMPWIPYLFLNGGDAIRKLRARRWSVQYEYIFLDPSGKDLEELSEYVEEGKLRPVIGSRVSFHDIEKVKEACMVVYNAKGGVGKTVIEVIADQ